MSYRSLKSSHSREGLTATTSPASTHHLRPPHDSHKATTSETRCDPDTRTFHKFTHHRSPPPPPKLGKIDGSSEFLSRKEKDLNDDKQSTTSEPSQESTTKKYPLKIPKPHRPSMKGTFHGETPKVHKLTTPKSSTRSRSKSISIPQTPRPPHQSQIQHPRHPSAVSIFPSSINSKPKLQNTRSRKRTKHMREHPLKMMMKEKNLMSRGW
jgi:hypothetical protein